MNVYLKDLVNTDIPNFSQSKRHLLKHKVDSRIITQHREECM
jgi:hypothetical protein